MKSAYVAQPAAEKSTWPTVALGEVCEFQPSKSEVRRKLEDTALVTFAPMESLGVGRKNLSATTSRPLSELIDSYVYFANGDVLLAKITPCFENGKLGIAKALENGVGFGSSEYLVIRPSNRISAQYLYYFLSQESFRAAAAKHMTGTAGQKRVSRSYVQSEALALPPITEQERIVAVLDEAFKTISAACKSTERSLEALEALHESYLTASLSRTGDGWKKAPFKHFCTIINGAQPAKAHFSLVAKPGFVRLIQIRDYKSDNHKTYIPESLARSWCEVDDVMIGRYGPPVFQILRGLSGAYNVALMKAVPRQTEMSKEFLFHSLRLRKLREVIVAESERASGQTGIRKDLLENYVFDYPSLASQEGIVSNLAMFERAKERLKNMAMLKLAKLSELKQSLLQVAFTGKL